MHRDVAPRFLPRDRARARAPPASSCAAARETRAPGPGRAAPATDADWDTEYLDLILAVKVVDSLDDAIDVHRAARHPASPTRSSPTDDAAAERFRAEVDSAAVFVNASTRFTDGFEFGFGAEIGISTNRLHARGPMGLRELTTYKYVVRGNGQVREWRAAGGIGLLGGTFNPVHLAHLRAAEEVREALALDRVRVRARRRRRRTRTPTSSRPRDDRLRMLELAIAGHPAFARQRHRARARRPVVLDRHAARAGAPSRTARFTFILGADAFAEIESVEGASTRSSRSCDVVACCSRPGVADRDEPPIADRKCLLLRFRSCACTHTDPDTSLSFQRVTALDDLGVRHPRTATRPGARSATSCPAAVEALHPRHTGSTLGRTARTVDLA